MPVYLPTDSPPATLTVTGEAKADFSYIANPPSEIDIGKTININAGLVNVGSASGYLFLEVLDADYGTSYGLSKSPSPVNVGVEWDATVSFTMPSPGRDIRIVLVAGHYRDTTKVGDKTSSTYTIIARIPTSLTIALSPSTVYPGQTVTVSGQLVRTDTSTGLASMKVEIWLGNSKVTEATTRSDGTYSTTITAPSTAGRYDYVAKFAGARGFSPSVAYARMYVDVIPTEAIIALSGIAVLGVAGLALYLMRK